MKYLPLFHHFKAIYQFPKHIFFLVKIVANASLKKYMYVSTLKIRNLPFNNIFQFLLNYNKNNMDFIYLFSISCLYKIFRQRSRIIIHVSILHDSNMSAHNPPIHLLYFTKSIAICHSIHVYFCISKSYVCISYSFIYLLYITCMIYNFIQTIFEPHQWCNC